MARNNIIRGLIKPKSWFFQKTSTPIKRGTRFLTDDRPNELTFRALLESFTNKADITDRAYEDSTNLSIDQKQGLTTLATDAQVLSRIAKSDTIARAVQPSQIPEVIAGDNITITNDTTSGRNKYIISAGSACPCVTGIGQDISETVPPGTDIIAIYDGTSFKGPSLTAAKERISTWYSRYLSSNPEATGSLIEITIGGSGNYNIIDKTAYSSVFIDERFLLFPKEYLNNNIQTASKITTYEGTVFENVNLPEYHTANGGVINSKCVFVIFEDECNDGSNPTLAPNGLYHAFGAGEASSVATDLYKQDHYEFTTRIHPRFEFFKGIVYPAVGSDVNYENWGRPITAGFQAFLTKAINKPTASSPGLTTLQREDGWDSEVMDGDNPFAADGVDNLAKYGWVSKEYAITGYLGSITQAEFNHHLDIAMSESASDTKLVTITPWIEYDNDIKVKGNSYTLKVVK